ncbi:uncharacterized protein LOC128965839 [Oppia nitens]|uniref:uncharacterized protein LOC128965839 n=1 Tax=Oppia nitens TaxID=1686743 RepID=UPI0023DADC88|nr:uncharacterized protein LOC128965839 [Oppia nitens]
MIKVTKDAATSPTVPIIAQQYYCTVTCCNNNNCKPSTILKGVRNPYYCPNRQLVSNGLNGCPNGVPKSCSFYSTPIPYTPTVSPQCLVTDNFYISGHGCFRRAVPTMPLFVAIFLTFLNLILPGSGTLLASLSILFGCNTEYGESHWFKAFLICLCSALLQTITAILVFGWVWSIMWGIVFIKNSLRYGDKRDIYSMSLC